MNKTIRFFCFLLVVIFSFTSNSNSSAQSLPDPEMQERIYSFWSLTFEQVRVEVGATQKEFDIFNRFYSNSIDTMQTAFNKQVFGGKLTIATSKEYMAARKVMLLEMYKKFKDVEMEYPTSVDEYRSPKRMRLSADSCYASCTNTDFEDGTLDGWYGYYGINNSTTNFNITGIVGGPLGPVTQAAQDPKYGKYISITYYLGVAKDWFLANYSSYSMPQVSPFGGKYSVMIGDSLGNGKGVAILSQSFQVTSASASLTYQYAVFLENPVPPHPFYEQPFFLVAVLDQNGDTIPACGSYNKSALYSDAPGSGFIGIPYPPRGDTIFWRNWSFVNVPLKNYVGQCVTVIFEVLDCEPSGHCGYAYVDASCAPENVIASSSAFCGQDSISLTAPPGWGKYVWSGNPTNGIISNDTLQNIYIDKPGTYTVITTNYFGNQCSDTLTIQIDSLPGPIPKPSFTANLVCAGQPTTFINTSNPIAGATFYWDFYNIGNYQDSLITNPTWTYSSPGTYIVKLHEVYNGCGADFYDTIKVDTSVNGGFTIGNSGCAPTAVVFTNTSVGATSFYWNFGDPSSNPNDTSTITVNGTHVYNTAGTYTVTLISKNGGPCPDTIRQVVNILGVPVNGIMGSDSVCAGGVDTLTATGGTTYLWAPGGQTSSSIAVTIVGPTTFTCSISNACGAHDTTITVNLAALPIALLSTDKDSICSGDTVKLTGGGGGNYKWSTGSTASTIKVIPLVTTTYTLHVFTASTTCQDSAVVTIFVTPTITSNVTLSADSVCPGTPVTLTVNSNGGPPNYTWSNGATTSSITVSPAVTTTYYVITSGRCADDSIGQVVTVIPIPSITIAPLSDTVCKGTPVTFTATGATNYVWSNGSTTNPTTITVNSDTTISVVGSTGRCSNKSGGTVKIYSPLVVTVSKDTVCAGGKAVISVSASGNKGPYNYSWNNGITADSAGPFTVAPPPNQYICVVTDGCGDISNDTVNVITRPAPGISFYPTPDTINGGGFVNFVNLTTGATGYYWTLGDGSTTTDTTPFHEYNAAGTYTVTLIATNRFGCTDTLTKDIYVLETISVPNIFTPNGDGINDVFHVTMGSMKTYDIQIFNRWGQKLFETTSPNIDWTGRSASGVMEADGTYYYIITATDYDNKDYKLDGYFQLMR